MIIKQPLLYNNSNNHNHGTRMYLMLPCARYKLSALQAYPYIILSTVLPVNLHVGVRLSAEVTRFVAHECEAMKITLTVT